MNKNRFYVSNGAVTAIPDEVPAEYLISDASDLAVITNAIPGSEACTADKLSAWVFSPNRKWIPLYDDSISDPTELSVAAAPGTDEVFGHTVSDLQENIYVGDDAITGKLKYVSSGSLVTEWGAGNFMTLKFDGSAFTKAQHIYVGMEPSVSSGMVDVKPDPDREGVFKVTNKLQKFKVVIDYGSYSKARTYDLTQLTLATA